MRLRRCHSGHGRSGDWIRHHLAAGARDDVDKYGRLLRYVEANGIDVNLAMIESGRAIARYDGRDGYGEHPRQAAYVAADEATPSLNQCVVPLAAPIPSAPATTTPATTTPAATTPLPLPCTTRTARLFVRPARPPSMPVIQGGKPSSTETGMELAVSDQFTKVANSQFSSRSCWYSEYQARGIVQFNDDAGVRVESRNSEVALRVDRRDQDRYDRRSTMTAGRTSCRRRSVG